MAEAHEGGCLCGAVRYRVVGEPIIDGVCHCTICKRRTGSAFGISAYFDKAAVQISGELKTYEYHSDESNRWIRMKFCPICGTSVTATGEVLPDARWIAGGTFDNPNWIKPSGHGWTRSALHWMVFPPDVELAETTRLKVTNTAKQIIPQKRQPTMKEVKELAVGIEMAESHEGGCLCGAVRYRAVGEPAVAGVCHCTYCKRRTGSAFGVGAYFAEAAVEITGVLKTYEYRSDESNRWLKTEFCPNCGTTVTWSGEALPGVPGIAAGTFGDPNWIKPAIHAWTRSALHWVVFPSDVSKLERQLDGEQLDETFKTTSLK
jgi:hypothetical protein